MSAHFAHLTAVSGIILSEEKTNAQNWLQVILKEIRRVVGECQMDLFVSRILLLYTLLLEEEARFVKVLSTIFCQITYKPQY